MVTRIDAVGAAPPQALTDTLAQALKGVSANPVARAQRLPLQTPGGSRPSPQLGTMTAVPMPSPKFNGTAVPMPNPKFNGTAVPMPNPKFNGTAVPMPNWMPSRTPRGEAVPRVVSGEWFRRAPPVRFDFEKAAPSVGRTPETDFKGTGKTPATPPAPVFTSAAQQQAFKSVVQIYDSRGEGEGSGVIVANKGDQYMLLTNQHCLIRKKAGDSVSFTLSDGTKVQGKIAAIGNPEVNDGHDLAAITFTSTRKLPVAKIATTEPKVDQKTFSIGYPFTGTGTSTSKPSDRVDPATGAMVAEGKVTANRRDGEGQIRGEYGLVTSSRVIQGMSGGGMFDSATGELIAINGLGAGAIMPPKVQDGKSFREAVGKEGRSVGIAAAEIGQFLRQNKAALPDFGRG